MADKPFQLKIKGLDELKRNLDKFPAKASGHLATFINKSILAIEKEARPITPVDTGFLVNSYAFGRIMVPTATTASKRLLIGRVKPSAKYAAEVSGRRNIGELYRNPSKNNRAVGGFVVVGAMNAQQTIDKLADEALKNIANEI